ncbi:MAG: polyphenol oxidase family protein [Candidatus Omnitrophica bacterium]|nr:polyphenol oxidase family protein [Candidatus Omnitrophota bacterium]MBU2251582.1 polyphenol oxidase family protein [Candidatus Omnitrophota bacterium]MBU2473465.1 polyphenol oxidase family protein [Candidatus Omnitrophota bacterium]
MKLTSHKYCSLFKECFPSFVTAGFSKNNLPGDLPQDIYTALSFLDQKFKSSYLNQVHSSKVILLAKEGIHEGDALFTKEKGLVLIVRTADCLPLIFASEKLGVIGVVHMGWRSAKAGILDNIDYCLESFKVVAGPGLRSCCYQVGDEFLTHPPFKDFIKSEPKGSYFDPISFAKYQLFGKGLKPENFLDSGLCSFCLPDDFFSFRRNQTSSRTLSFILKI